MATKLLFIKVKYYYIKSQAFFKSSGFSLISFLYLGQRAFNCMLKQNSCRSCHQHRRERRYGCRHRFYILVSTSPRYRFRDIDADVNYNLPGFTKPLFIMCATPAGQRVYHFPAYSFYIARFWWHIVTVAFLERRSIATGLPITMLRPTTTALYPQYQCRNNEHFNNSACRAWCKQSGFLKNSC